MKKITTPLLISTLTAAMSVFCAGLTTAAESARTPVNVASLGPQVGEPAPDFSLPDQNGQLHNLESIMGPNGAMLLFHRSADW